MATVLGAGTLYFAPTVLAGVVTAAPRTSAPPPPPPPSSSSPMMESRVLEAHDLLERIANVLADARVGMNLGELRARLAEPTAALQRALAVGLRERQLRRVGAHNGLRYVLNA